MSLSRLKTWLDEEEITALDLNAEFDNIINGMTPSNIGDISSNVAEMQQTQDPGSVGSENLPTNLREEILELRSMIQKISGGSEWYEPPQTSIALIASGLGLSTKTSGPVSGLVDANGQPQFLQADGGSQNVNLLATGTEFVYKVAGVNYSVNLDDSLTLDAGPAAANDEGTIYDGGGEFSVGQWAGESKGSPIPLASVGTEITSRRGSISLFRVQSQQEYLIGIPLYNGVRDELMNCIRGFFFNSSLANARVNLTSSNKVEILKLHWIFINTTGTLLKTTLVPLVQANTPSGPSTNQYWFDLNENIWKRYDGAQWVDSEAALIGFAGVDASNNCICARSIDFIAEYSHQCDLSLEKMTDSIVIATRAGFISNYGVQANLYSRIITWDMSTDRDTGISESSDTIYYCYIDSNFQPKISNFPPHDRQTDLKGWYHPFKPWRCIGGFLNDSSSNIDKVFTLSNETQIADSSISSKKLQTYSEAPALIASAYHIGNQVDQGLIDVDYDEVSGVPSPSSPLTIFSSGRPILVSINLGCLVGDDFLTQFNIQKRRPSESLTWGLVYGSSASDGSIFSMQSNGSSEGKVFSFNFVDTDMKPGIVQYRIEFVTAISFNNLGSMQALGLFKILEM